MTVQRLTKVQRDVIDRLCDGWHIWDRVESTGRIVFQLRKNGEPSRHVRGDTVDSLLIRGLVKPDSQQPFRLVIAS